MEDQTADARPGHDQNVPAVEVATPETAPVEMWGVIAAAPDEVEEPATASPVAAVESEVHTAAPLEAEGQTVEAPKKPLWIRALARRFRIPVWALLLVFGVALAIGQGDQAVAEKRASDAEQRASAAEAREAKAQELKRDADADAANALTVAKQQVQAEFVARESELASERQKFEQAKQELAAKEAELTAKTQALHATSFSDGTYEVGRDIQPGKYRTEGGSTCYWEKRRDDSGGLGSIIDNDNANGPITVVIDGAVKFFKSQRCGTWVKIG